MAQPLVFLTSTSNSAPSGRNARVIARASMVQQGSGPTQGTIYVFQIDQSQKRRNLNARQQCDIPRFLGPQQVTINELLAKARIKVRHGLALSLKERPYEVRAILRCRQWAVAAYAMNTLELTPDVYKAIKYLEYKMLTKNESKQNELQLYGSAISELQKSLRDRERCMQSGVLAASHILAICEMLDNTTNNNYLKFANGIVTLSVLQAQKGDNYARDNVRSRASPVLIDALLTNRYDIVLDKPWSFILIASAQKAHISLRYALHAADSAVILFEDCHISGTDRSRLVAKAYMLLSLIKQSIQQDMSQPVEIKYVCPLTETVAERIAIMLALEDLICNLGADDAFKLVQADNYSFYVDVLGTI